MIDQNTLQNAAIGQMDGMGGLGMVPGVNKTIDPMKMKIANALLGMGGNKTLMGIGQQKAEDNGQNLLAMGMNPNTGAAMTPEELGMMKQRKMMGY